MSDVESRSLRYFVAVGEELSFSRAAQRLGIASPALSRAIARLEAQLGVRLLERSTRRVELTEPGALLLADSRSALRALDAATARVRRAAGPEGGSLVLAVKADVEGGLLEELLTAFPLEHPGVPLDVVFTGWDEQAAMVRAGSADAAIVLAPFDTDSLDAESLMAEPQVLAVAVGHPLATRARLRMSDLEEGHRQVGPGTHVYVATGAQRPEFADMTQMLRQIEIGRMVAVVPVSFAERIARSQLVWVPIDDAPTAEFFVVWPQGSRSLAIAALVRVASAIARRRPGDGDDLPIVRQPSVST